MVKAVSILNIMGIAVGVVVSCAGIGLLTGYLLPNTVSEQVRLILGIMCVVYGVFRTGATLLRTKQMRREEETHEK